MAEVRLTVRRADGFFARLKGLMFERSIGADVGLWINPCRGIHTFFMRFPIDAIFLDRDLRVVNICPNLPPNRIGVFCREAVSVLECESGFIARNNITIGRILEFHLSPLRGERAGVRMGAGTACFRLALAGVILFYAAVAFFPSVQRWYVQKFHPGRMPFAVWAPMQLVPSMYSFENRVELTSREQKSSIWTNHYPLRSLSFRLDRSGFKTGGPYDVELVSQYRDESLRTRYRLEWTGHAFDVKLLPP